MAVQLSDEAQKKLLTSIQQFFLETMEEDFGDLRAKLVLDFCLKEIGPSIYNQAIADAHAYFQGKLEDLEGTCWEPEFSYWTDKK